MPLGRPGLHVRADQELIAAIEERYPPLSVFYPVPDDSSGFRCLHLPSLNGGKGINSIVRIKRFGKRLNTKERTSLQVDLKKKSDTSSETISLLLIKGAVCLNSDEVRATQQKKGVPVLRISVPDSRSGFMDRIASCDPTFHSEQPGEFRNRDPRSAMISAVLPDQTEPSAATIDPCGSTGLSKVEE